MTFGVFEFSFAYFLHVFSVLLVWSCLIWFTLVFGISLSLVLFVLV